MRRSGKRKRWQLIAIGAVCAGCIWFALAKAQQDPSEDSIVELLEIGLLSGIPALVTLAYKIFRPEVLATRVLFGLGAITATICSGVLGFCVWRGRSWLAERDTLGLMVVLLVVATGLSGLAWWNFFQQSRTSRSDRSA
jgi:hypothetical protein